MLTTDDQLAETCMHVKKFITDLMMDAITVVLITLLFAGLWWLFAGLWWLFTGGRAL